VSAVLLSDMLHVFRKKTQQCLPKLDGCDQYLSDKVVIICIEPKL